MANSISNYDEDLKCYAEHLTNEIILLSFTLGDKEKTMANIKSCTYFLRQFFEYNILALTIIARSVIMLRELTYPQIESAYLLSDKDDFYFLTNYLVETYRLRYNKSNKNEQAPIFSFIFLANSKEVNLYNPGLNKFHIFDKFEFENEYYAFLGKGETINSTCKYYRYASSYQNDTLIEKFIPVKDDKLIEIFKLIRK